ncbi:MAG: hypothetical protein OSA77_01205 [Halioglobus sp.]|jgi:hypothetical protein|nr:hypothetical protein [Halioglobus sp.]
MAVCLQSLFDMAIADVAVFAAGTSALGTFDSALQRERRLLQKGLAFL